MMADLLILTPKKLGFYTNQEPLMVLALILHTKSYLLVKTNTDILLLTSYDEREVLRA